MANEIVLNNRQARAPATAEGGLALFLGALFTLIGTALVLVGVGIIATDKAPKAILGFIGFDSLLAGLLFLFHGVRGSLASRRATASEAQRPGVPWTWDYAWDPRGTVDENPRNALRMSVTGILMLLFVLPINVFVFTSPGRTTGWVGAAILADLIALMPIGWSVYLWLQVLRSGRVRARFGTFPFQLGSTLTVNLQLPGWTKDLTTLRATLRCIEERRVTTGTGNHQSTVTQIFQVYASDIPLALQPGAERSAMASISFDLPTGDYSTRMSRVPPRYWELELSAARPGIDYDARLLLPIY